MNEKNISHKFDIPVFKVFEYKTKFYLYDTYSNSLLNITQKMYEELLILKKIGWDKYLHLSENNKTVEYADILKLYHRDMLKCNFIKEIKHPETDVIKDLINRSINDIVLQVTRSCNFKCRYCLYATDNDMERSHENINMDFDIAKEAIDFLFDHSCDADSINISFYGGEPLLNFELIESIVDYANAVFKTKSLNYSMTINASLLTERIIRYIIANEFNVAISLDGPEEVQNSHRRFKVTGSETYRIVISNVEKIKKIDEEYFDNHVTFLPVIIDDEDFEKVKLFYERMGVSADRVKALQADLSGVDYIFNEIQLEQNRSGNQSEQKFEVGSYPNFLLKLKAKNKLPSVWHHSGQCIPGVHRLFVDVFGNFFPCEKITENKAYSIGNLKNGLDLERILSFLNIGCLSDDQCKRCWAMRFCEMCISGCLDVERNMLTADRKLYSCVQKRESALINMKHYIDMQLHRGVL